MRSSVNKLELFAAGSLRAALDAIADLFENTNTIQVTRVFGPSGLLRERIEHGDRPNLFASANLVHPKLLEAQKLGGPVLRFAQNRLCAIVHKETAITSATLIEAILDPRIRVGTATPGADPAGDYAWEFFCKLDRLKPGALILLNEKAMQLTGGSNNENAPDGQSPYVWVMGNKKADLFLTYATNAMLTIRELPELDIVQIPEILAVGAEYGLLILEPKTDAASDFARFVVSPPSRGILKSFGFGIPLG